MAPMLFYSDWPLGYVNQEAERKAEHFASRGDDVVYVAGVGIRNPRLHSIGKLVDRASRKLRGGTRAARPASAPRALRSGQVLVVPPRQLAPVRRANAAWMARQLRGLVHDWPSATAWIRHATPELVDALEGLRPGVVVYESVDAHHEGPGLVGPWRAIFDDAERRLVALSDVVIVTAESLRPRLEGFGGDVRFVPHGVDLFPWRPRTARPGGGAVLGFVGVLDVRLDPAVIRHVARRRPDWHIRLVGPVEHGFDPASVAGIPNVSLEPPVPHTRVGEVLAELDLGLLAYRDIPVYRHMSPLKNLELMAAGRPVVVRPTPALEPFGELVYPATTPEEFLAQADRALAEDSAELARRRRSVAEARSWSAQLEELSELLRQTRAAKGL